MDNDRFVKVFMVLRHSHRLIRRLLLGTDFWCCLGFSHPLLMEGCLILWCIEAVIDFEVLQDFITGIAFHRAAIAQQLLDCPAHQMCDGMRAHDLAAQFARHIHDKPAAIHTVLGAFEQLEYSRIALGYHRNQSGPDLLDSVLDIDDILIENDLRQLTLLPDLRSRILQQCIRYQRLAHQCDFPAVGLAADFNMTNDGRLQEFLLLIIQCHALDQLPECIFFFRYNPKLLHTLFAPQGYNSRYFF